jgi:hypothetical protein
MCSNEVNGTCTEVAHVLSFGGRVGSLVPFVAFALGRSLLISCSFLLIRVGIIVIPYALSKGILFSSIYLGKGKVDLSIETYVLGSFIRLLFFVCFGL